MEETFPEAAVDNMFGFRRSILDILSFNKGPGADLVRKMQKESFSLLSGFEHDLDNQ